MPRHATRTSFKKGHIPWHKGKKIWGRKGILKRENPVKGKHIWKNKEHPKGMLGKKNPTRTILNKSSEFTKRRVKTFKENYKMGKFTIPKSKSMLGKHHSKKTKKKMGKCKKGIHNPMKRPTVAKKLSETRKRLYREGKLSSTRGFFGKQHTKFSKAQISEKSKENWKREGYRQKVITNALRMLRQRPTSYEQKIIELTKEYTLPFKYVGNGEVIISGKNPDFIESNGKKHIIETYAKYWHPGDYEKVRANVFSAIGYQTLFLSDDDLERSDWKKHCISKIVDFMGGV